MLFAQPEGDLSHVCWSRWTEQCTLRVPLKAQCDANAERQVNFAIYGIGMDDGLHHNIMNHSMVLDIIVVMFISMLDLTSNN
jgi:hypothetical protein